MSSRSRKRVDDYDEDTFDYEAEDGQDLSESDNSVGDVDPNSADEDYLQEVSPELTLSALTFYVCRSKATAVRTTSPSLSPLTPRGPSKPMPTLT